MAHINKLPDEVLRSAELALFCKRPEEALNILLQNKRIYRAIKRGRDACHRETDIDIIHMYNIYIYIYLCIYTCILGMPFLRYIYMYDDVDGKHMVLWQDEHPAAQMDGCAGAGQEAPDARGHGAGVSPAAPAADEARGDER